MNQILKSLALLLCGGLVCFILFYTTSALEHHDLLDRAQKGDPAAEEVVGNAYLRGNSDFPKDTALAVKWLDKAAHAGRISAMHKLADLYLRGEGVLQSHRLYIDYHAMAADYLDDNSLTVIGQAMIAGDDIRKDPEQGVRLISAAAKDNYGPAQSLLGQFYFEGKLVPCDPKAARKWLSSAVAKKDDTAALWLASLDRGEGCTPQDTSARAPLFGKEINEKSLEEKKNAPDSTEKQGVATEKPALSEKKDDGVSSPKKATPADEKAMPEPGDKEEPSEKQAAPAFVK